ncbi:Aste57867_3714 [Aphanomyces stellatus]|uniref:Aste57867_3714 protein n=1 Tax=Aphanomyces stellatus TaxID=120398 RepID=A0A485KBW4_9STRA|nr:hypothetical protein As57867_003703 [Aphanomyces stellatus]VFT80868.1 Aste57867_3714 [Aphanomyces stellatus]
MFCDFKRCSNASFLNLHSITPEPTMKTSAALVAALAIVTHTSCAGTIDPAVAKCTCTFTQALNSERSGFEWCAESTGIDPNARRFTDSDVARLGNNTECQKWWKSQTTLFRSITPPCTFVNIFTRSGTLLTANFSVPLTGFLKFAQANLASTSEADDLPTCGGAAPPPEDIDEP